MIKCSLFGENKENEESKEFANQFNKLSINQEEKSSQEINNYLSFEDPLDSLMKRPRSAHLTFIQKQWIYMNHRDTDEPLNSISQPTGVSISTIRRIVMEFSTNVKRSEIYSKIRCKRLIESEQIAKLIFNYVRNQTGWFTAKNMQHHIKNELSVMIPLHQIRKHLKLKEGLSFKKGNSRPININIDQVKLLQKLFWVKIANILPEMKLLINIDESSISRYTTTNYSWLKTGTSCAITNTCFIKSVDLITVITTTGLVINMLKSERRNAKIFDAFLNYVIKRLEEEGFAAGDCGIILDNCSIHRSELVMTHWRKTGIKLFYLPQYLPELAPVEVYFSLLKRRFVQEWKGESLNLWTIHSIKTITKWIHEIEAGFIRKLWHILMEIIWDELGNINLHF